MTVVQFADLQLSIQRWVDHACEESDWPSIIVGDETVALMASAARCVFDACQESQAYALREGYMRTR